MTKEKTLKLEQKLQNARKHLEFISRSKYFNIKGLKKIAKSGLKVSK